MHWWDAVVLVVTCLSFVGLCWQLFDSWWRQDPRGEAAVMSSGEGHLPARRKVSLMALGADALYNPIISTEGCALISTGHPHHRWVPDVNVISGNGRLDFVVALEHGCSPNSARVEISWVSGRDRRRSQSRLRYWPWTARYERWRRYRAPWLHSAPGRWVERTQADEGER